MFAGLPGTGIAIDVEGSQDEKEHEETAAERVEEFSPSIGLPLKDRCQAVAAGHEPAPGEEGVGHGDPDAADLQHHLAMQAEPDRAEVGIGWHGEEMIEEPASGEDGETEGEDDVARQVDQASQEDHAGSDGPDDSEDDPCEGVRNLEFPGEGDDGHFQKDQPEPPAEEKTAEFGFRFPLCHEAHGKSGEENEGGGAEVSDPAGEVEREGDIGIGHGILARAGEKVPDVIQRHDDHDKTAKPVDRFQALSWLHGLQYRHGLARDSSGKRNDKERRRTHLRT